MVAVMATAAAGRAPRVAVAATVRAAVATTVAGARDREAAVAGDLMRRVVRGIMIDATSLLVASSLVVVGCAMFGVRLSLLLSW